MSYKQKIQVEVQKALNGSGTNISLERTKQKEHGDIATNIAMVLAKELKRNPLDIANEIKERIKSHDNLISHIEIAKPGFINFTVGDFALSESLSEVHQFSRNYGLAQTKSKEKILIEYVSANPTGDLHIGHGRQAAIGGSLTNLTKAAGYDVISEFYINDHGEQIAKLAAASWELQKKINGENYVWLEDFYPEELIEKYLKAALANLKKENLTKENLGNAVKEIILQEQKKLLEKISVHFDNWFSETSLYTNKKVEEVLKKLKEKNYTYEQEGAIWFKAKEFGDVRDRVLVRSDGRSTYLLADIAYHIDKLNRSNRLITIWGADHHGQEVSLKGALKALEYDENKLEIIFVQLVSLKKDGQEVKMSKRAGTVINIEELIYDYHVSPDAIRYFLVETSPNNRMVFDIDLAVKQDKDNPVYYIQYAYARCCSIFRQLEQNDIDIKNQYCTSKFIENPELFMPLFNVNNLEYNLTKSLILKILDFPEEVLQAAMSRSSSRIANYLKDLATDFHQFYNTCRVITKNTEQSIARLALIEATKITISNGLNILGITAPESM